MGTQILRLKFREARCSHRDKVNHMRRVQLIIIGSLLTVYQLLGQCRGSIDGKVIDEDGKPVAGALVSFEEHRLAMNHKAVEFYQTDSGGSFHAALELAGLGSYRVLAKKEEAGYPETRFAFYDDNESPLLGLECGTALSGIVVKLGPKAAHIHHITVLDADSGELIANASITLRRLSAPFRSVPLTAFSITTSTTLLPPNPNYPGLAVPANVDVSYQISAPGYIASPETTLHLAPSKGLDISVTLRRSNPTPAPPP